ncbi:YtxH domain-containing protein [Streptobacillus canis]|uniref:YtxH domain-containing protein n=1 Tax=Streptobacillus canis TaxID=2678686 RepID=UPI0012E16F48|nr:YtxH domain-containing protein [Streptobacillus canis]
MAKEILEKLEEIEKLAKDSFESSQKELHSNIENLKLNLEESFTQNIKEYKVELVEKLNKEKDELRNSLEYKITEMKDKSEKLSNNFHDKIDLVLEEVKNIVMKG